MNKRKVLVLCIDRDNDLREKAKVNGPIIGRDANLEAATKLALADPEEPDANAIFEAVKEFDELKKSERNAEVQVATLTGSRKLGYTADKEISRQLDKIMSEFQAESCVFVSDGYDDEEVLPIVNSRVKVDSTKIVIMKQAKELEKTYFVLLEKLKEPYYARIILGIPALVILAFAISEMLGFGWKPVVFVIGAYLLLKGFGFEEAILSKLLEFKFSVENISFVVYLAALPLVLISVWLGFQEYSTATAQAIDSVKIVAYTIRSTLILLPWAAVLAIAGMAVDSLREGRKFEIAKHGLYVVTVFLLWILLKTASDWVVADAYFIDFVKTIMFSIILAFVAIEATKRIRASIAAEMKLENKEALNEFGTYLGKIVGIDKKKSMLFVQTPLGQKLSYQLEQIASIDEKVVVKR
ncbi:DUF373 family protein [Candidatus Micrarchaeota archaeon]|nr:DUF373 family protein [Candidatus Micrarchaeota archaeon]